MEKLAVTNETVSLNNKVIYAASDYISANGIKENCLVADGINIVNYSDDNKLTTGEQRLYPLYCDGQLNYVLIENKENIVIKPLSEEAKEMFTGNCAVVHYNGNVYAISGNDAVNLLNESDSDEKMFKLKKLNVSQLLASKLNDNKKEVYHCSNGVIMIDGIEVSNNRITVKFAEGDTASFIEQYKSFCKGEMISSLPSANIYVFQMEQLSTVQMDELIENSLQLDYVTDAFAEKVNNTGSGVKPVVYDK